MNILNPTFIITEKLKAKMAVDEFLTNSPTIFEIQTYIQMAQNDLENNPNDIYALEIINLLSIN